VFRHSKPIWNSGGKKVAIMFRITPKEEIFFDLFVEAAKNCSRSAEMLEELMVNYVSVNDKIKQIEELEHECDQNVHNILKQLNKSFITPIDREDIHAIAKEMDNITDAIESTAHRFRMFNVSSIKEDAKKIVNLIVQCTKELTGIMEEMKNMKTSTELEKKIIEVNRIENVGDEIYRDAIAHLFVAEKDAIEVVKWKEIYEYLENTLDACEDVANLVEGVVMKHA
jgi:predicted phosphate transport protein (TIGR00153 family)